MATEPISVVLRERSAHERLAPGQGHVAVLECGYRGARTLANGTRKEKGRKVAVLLNDAAEIPGALHALADLWDGYMRRNRPNNGTTLVRFRIPNGAVGDQQCKPSELADALHRMADLWAAARVLH